MRMAAAILVMPAVLLGCTPAPRKNVVPLDRLHETRAQLEQWYAQNNDAFRRWDVEGVMALRAPDFHTVAPDGVTRDRAAMELYTRGLLNGIRQWNTLTIVIDSLRVAGDTAVAIVSQHVDRLAIRPDNQIRRVQTWATQRETFVRSGTRWLLWRVDQVRDQRRVIDPEEGAVRRRGA